MFHLNDDSSRLALALSLHGLFHILDFEGALDRNLELTSGYQIGHLL
jgi:hypothetical protein